MKKSLYPIKAAAIFLCSLAAIFATTSEAQTKPKREIKIDYNAQPTQAPQMEVFSIGADYPGTLARDDGMAQLSVLQNEIGFKYIRFHGIFHDTFETFKLIDGKPQYNFTKIDKLYDDLLARGIKPFVELGFTPNDMRTSEQTIFYWKGNTSHPKDELWIGLIDAFLRHLIERYGEKEVMSWYFEVWNEPNLDGFWERADKAAYFHLYDITHQAIKKINPALKVGGPSTAGAAWVPEFIENGIKNQTPPDFITTHAYGVDSGFLDEFGGSDQKLSPNKMAVTQDVINVRQQIENSPLKGAELFFTEWSTSYNPRDTVHDSYLSAAYILDKLRAVDGIVQGMSYWTYSDLFEEPGPPTAEFQGGFGLLTPNGIRKPAYFAYKYLNEIGVNRLVSKDKQSYIGRDNNGIRVLTWDYTYPKNLTTNRNYFTKLQPSKPIQRLDIIIANLPIGQYQLIERRIGFEKNDAQSEYIKMGSPPKPSESQLNTLQMSANDVPNITNFEIKTPRKKKFTYTLRENDVLFIEIKPQP